MSFAHAHSVFSRTASTNHLAADIAELALGAASHHAFTDQLVALLAARIGADTAASFSASSTLEHIRSSSSTGDAPHLTQRMPSYMLQIAPREMAAAMQPRAQPGCDIICQSRRDHLLLYTEYLQPHGFSSYAMRMWSDADSVHWVALAVGGGSRAERFMKRAMAQIDGVFPVIAVSMRLHQPTKADEGVSREVTATYCITPSEHRILELVERGLTNREIATILGISANTVRNRLVSAFGKLDVTRRSEAIYILRTQPGR